jgi:hypothetical protein
MKRSNITMRPHSVKVRPFHYVETPPAPVIKYWDHRYDSPLAYASCAAALAKGFIPVFNVFNPADVTGDSHANRLWYARHFQTAHGGCKIALRMNFFAKFDAADVAWDIETWTARLANRVVPDGITDVWINVEPVEASLAILVTGVDPAGSGKLGTAGTAKQVAAGLAFVRAQSKFSVGLPDYRGATGYAPATTPGSLYTVLTLLADARVNEFSYDPSHDLSTMDSNDIVGLRVSIDGSNNSWTPEQASAFMPTRSKFFYPAPNRVDKAEEELEIISRLG